MRNERDDLDMATMAKTLRALRGQESQLSLSSRIGVGNHVIHRLENQTLDTPRIDDLAKIAKAFGLDLNAMGALMGIWEVPEQEGDHLTPELRRIIGTIRDEGKSLDAAEQNDLTSALTVALALFRRLRERTQAQVPGDGTAEDALADLPAWLRRRLG